MSLFHLIALSVAHKQVKEQFSLLIQSVEALTTDAEAVEGAAQYQIFQTFPIHVAQIDALHEIIDILERAIFFSLRNDGLCRSLSHSFDSCKSETYLSFFVDTELHVAFVHIGAIRVYIHRLALIHELGHFRDVALTPTHDCRHEFCRIVRFQVCRLECHPRITRRMTFIESIGGKFLPVFPDFFQLRLVVSVFLSTLIEEFFQFLHLVNLLLSHRFAKAVALTACEVCQLT